MVYGHHLNHIDHIPNYAFLFISNVYLETNNPFMNWSLYQRWKRFFLYTRTNYPPVSDFDCFFLSYPSYLSFGCLLLVFRVAVADSDEATRRVVPFSYVKFWAIERDQEHLTCFRNHDGETNSSGNLATKVFLLWWIVSVRRRGFIWSVSREDSSGNDDQTRNIRIFMTFTLKVLIIFIFNQV